MRLFAIASLAVLATACGGRAGGTCNSEGFLCQDASSALECKVGVWVALPCRGPTGCQRQGDLVRCDMAANVAGDACASTVEGKGLCMSDGLGTLGCRDGTLVKTNVCRTCTVSADMVVCQP